MMIVPRSIQTHRLDSKNKDMPVHHIRCPITLDQSIEFLFLSAKRVQDHYRVRCREHETGEREREREQNSNRRE